MNPPPRRFRFSVEAEEPIYTGDVLCLSCGLAYSVVVSTDEPNPLQDVRLTCQCGRTDFVTVEEPPDDLNED